MPSFDLSDYLPRHAALIEHYRATLPAGIILDNQLPPALAGIDRTTLWRWERRGDFPAPLLIGHRGGKGRKTDELIAWLCWRVELAEAKAKERAAAREATGLPRKPGRRPKAA